MTTDEFLRKIIEIKDTALATTSLEGNPSNRIVDMMYKEDECLFFLTAKGKNMYRELKNNPHVSLAVCKKKIAYSLNGIVEEMDSEKYLPLLFENNKFMNELYPGDTKKALTVFRINNWTGEYFDLNKRPIERMSFSNKKITEKGYFIIKENCIQCGNCLESCPQKCIDIGNKSIIQMNCLHCGNCKNVCMNDAIEVRE